MSETAVDDARPQLPRWIAAIIIGAIALASLAALVWPSLPLTDPAIGDGDVAVVTAQLGEPGAAGRVGAIPTFLRDFPARVPLLGGHAAGHPAGVMVLYALVARVRPGPLAAALATVALGALGAVAAGGLARDELGERGGRLALALWGLAPGVVLYLATSADAVFAALLGAAALAAHRGLVRRSAAWTAAGGALLWAAAMLTYSAALLLVFLGVRAAGRPWAERGATLRWAAGTAAVALALAAGLWLATGYDVPAALRATQRAYQAAPGSAGRPLLPWVPGDLLAFAGMLGVPLAAALAARAVAVVRERAFTSLDAAALATLLAAASWGFTRGEVERIFQFLVPLVLVPAARQLLAWRARVPLVAALLLAQTLAVQLLFATRW
jgi:hypothetical protein